MSVRDMAQRLQELQYYHNMLLKEQQILVEERDESVRLVGHLASFIFPSPSPSSTPDEYPDIRYSDYGSIGSSLPGSRRSSGSFADIRPVTQQQKRPVVPPTLPVVPPTLPTGKKKNKKEPKLDTGSYQNTRGAPTPTPTPTPTASRQQPPKQPKPMKRERITSTCSTSSASSSSSNEYERTQIVEILKRPSSQKGKRKGSVDSNLSPYATPWTPPLEGTAEECPSMSLDGGYAGRESTLSIEDSIPIINFSLAEFDGFIQWSRSRTNPNKKYKKLKSCISASLAKCTKSGKRPIVVKRKDIRLQLPDLPPVKLDHFNSTRSMSMDSVSSMMSVDSVHFDDPELVTIRLPLGRKCSIDEFNKFQSWKTYGIEEDQPSSASKEGKNKKNEKKSDTKKKKGKEDDEKKDFGLSPYAAPFSPPLDAKAQSFVPDFSLDAPSDDDDDVDELEPEAMLLENFQCWSEKGDKSLKENNRASAIEEYSQALLIIQDVDVVYKRACALFEEGKYLGTSRYPALQAKSQVNYRRALQDVSVVVRSSEEQEQIYHCLLIRARICLAFPKRDRNTAIPDLNKVIKYWESTDEPSKMFNGVELFELRGHVYRNLLEPTMATKDYNRAIALNSDVKRKQLLTNYIEESKNDDSARRKDADDDEEEE